MYHTRKSTLRRSLKLALIVTFAGIALGPFFQWIDKRDEALGKWAEKYEECVKVEYNTTPSEWYWEHGEYPECVVNE